MCDSCVIFVSNLACVHRPMSLRKDDDTTDVYNMVHTTNVYNTVHTIQGKSSNTPVTSDLSKMFHQICLWLHQLVKTKKSTEDSVIYSIPTATCQQQQTTPNHACLCVCVCRPEVLPYRTKK